MYCVLKDALLLVTCMDIFAMHSCYEIYSIQFCSCYSFVYFYIFFFLFFFSFLVSMSQLARGYKTFFNLSSAEHEISTAHKC